jgi:GH25 family lysozyme M1 (1,4-beta-N-acetylmuramidase)
MRSRGWWALGATGVLVCAALVRTFTADAGTTVPDGGGWAHAGAAPGSRTAHVEAAPAGYLVSGIDVSSHDHSTADIDWAGVAAGGTAFAYVKATEGLSYVNPYFGTDYQAAKNAGLYAGAYTFGRPDLGNPVGQADFFVDQSLWTGDSRTLIPFLDMEWPYGALHLGPCWNLTPAAMSAWIRSFVTEVQARIGRPPMIYTNANWWNPCTGNDASFGSYPLDIAGYTATPPALPAGWSTFALWQYAPGDASQPGNYDKDVFNGDLAGLATLAGRNPPTVVSLLSHADGQFVTADPAGQVPLYANRSAIGAWEQFDEVPAGGGYVALRSHANGRYVTADAGGTAPLVANRTVIGAWEKFQLVPNGDGSVSLKANANGRYVTAERAGAAALVANRTGVGSWEKFDAVPPPVTVTLRARAGGGYVSADRAGNAALIANRVTAGAWELFDKLDLGGGYIALRAEVNGRYVTADQAGAAPLYANRTAIGTWERFQLVSNPDGSVSLRAVANSLLVTDYAGAGPLTANRTVVGAWEEFDLS